jgi:ABC-2 type transport system ATP-binding protein
MEEAERLCDRVAIIDAGELIALDTPEALIRSLGGETRLLCTVVEGVPPLEALRNLPSVHQLNWQGGRLEILGDGANLVQQVVVLLGEQGVRVLDLRTEQPGLEDVFLALTGRQVRE